MNALPLFLRRFLLDFVETALGLVFALTIAFPGTWDDGKAVAITLGGAVLSALVSAARRAIPGLLAWLRGVLAVPDDGAE